MHPRAVVLCILGQLFCTSSGILIERSRADWLNTFGPQSDVRYETVRLLWETQLPFFPEGDVMCAAEFSGAL